MPKPHLAEGWVPDDETLGRFADYLRSQQIVFTDTEFAANRDWMRDQIRYELYFRAFDKKTADRAALQADPPRRRRPLTSRSAAKPHTVLTAFRDPGGRVQGRGRRIQNPPQVDNLPH